MTGDNQPENVSVWSPPGWWHWVVLSSIALAPVVDLRTLGIPWPDGWPLFSLGLIPLLAAGAFLLAAKEGRAVFSRAWPSAWPGFVWPLAALFGMGALGSAGAGSAWILASWIVQAPLAAIIFRVLVADERWRDRMAWTLAVAVVAASVAVARLFMVTPAAGDPSVVGGVLGRMGAFGAFLALSLPLLAAWRGGSEGKSQGWRMMSAMFLLPALALSVCRSGAGLAAAMGGLSVSWMGWRRHSWILGVFLCLLVFGQGNSPERFIARMDGLGGDFLSSSPDGEARAALDAWKKSPAFGSGLSVQLPSGMRGGGWLFNLAGDTGWLGVLAMAAMMAELAARSAGRDGKRCLWASGVMGAVVAVCLGCWWIDFSSPGVAMMIGLVLAVSSIDGPRAESADAKAGKPTAG